MRLNLFVFRPDDGPAFEVWAPQGMRQREAPENAGALVAETEDGFAPNLVVGHNRVSADMTLEALTVRLQNDAAALPGARVHSERTLPGLAGEVRVIAFTHPGRDGSGPLYQMTACLLGPSAEPDDAERGDGDSVAGRGERDLVYLTGTCTVDQMPRWDPAFMDAASTMRFG
jgi:hypothetical protein